MIKFYDYVRYYMWLGMCGDMDNEYQVLAVKLLDDCLDQYGDTFTDAVRIAAEIGGEEALVNFYDTVTRIHPDTVEVKEQALSYLHGETFKKDVYYAHDLEIDGDYGIEMYRTIHKYEP